eukprot:symbB.v1.2.018476.t2/scaffold1476.1/size116376/5
MDLPVPWNSQTPYVYKAQNVIKKAWREAYEKMSRLAYQRILLDVVPYNAAITKSTWTLAGGMFKTNVITYNATLKALGAHWLGALEQIRSLQQNALELQILTFNMASSACVKGNRWQRAALQMLRLNLNSSVDCNTAALLLANSFCMFSLLMDVISQSSLASASSKHRWQMAVAVLDSDFHGVEPDIVAFNSHITENAWILSLCLLRRLGLRPTTITWNTLAESKAWQVSLSQREAGFTRGPKSVAGFDLDLLTMTAILSHRPGHWPEVLKALRLGQLRPTAVTCSALISACEGHWSTALGMFQLHEIYGLQSDLLVHNGVIGACEKTKRWEIALQLLFLEETPPTSKFKVDEISCTGAIMACGRASEWQVALLLLAKMQCILVQSHVISYNAAISACEEAGQWQSAADLLDSMTSSLLPPDPFSYNTFISACDKALRWRHATHAFSKVLLVNGRNSKEKTVQGIVTFNTTSSACGKSQQWQWAMYLIAKLPQDSRTSFVESSRFRRRKVWGTGL